MVRSRAGAWFRIFALAALVLAGLLAFAEDEFKGLVQKAFELHQHGDFPGALPLLHRAYAMQPDDYFVNLLLGIDSLRTGEVKGSIPYLKKASRLRPKEEFPLAYLGEAYARRELFGDAAAAYMRAVEVAPGSAEASVAFVDFALARFGNISGFLRSSTKGLAAEYRLRALAHGLHDSDQAPLLQRAADLDPTAPGIWSDLARAAFDGGDAGAAAEACRRALQVNPNDLQAWLVDARLAAQAGEWKRVNLRLNAVAGRSPQMLSSETGKWPARLQPPQGVMSGAAARFAACVRNENARCQFGVTTAANLGPDKLFDEQRWEQVTKLAAPSPEQPRAWLRRGVAFASLDDCAHAIPALERGVATASPDLYGLFELSRCYSEQAGRAAEQVQQSGENQASVHTMRGDIFLRLQAKPDLAMAEYERALTMAANDPALLERLAEAQFGAGKADPARASAQAALKIDPQRAGAKRTLAKIAMQDRDYAAALPYLRELAARNPRDVTGRVELAKACAQTGAWDEAWQNLAPALEHGYPDEKGTLHYLLGTVLKRMDRGADAERAFAEAAQLSDAFQHKSYRDQDPDAQP
ncbi:MAG TPA: tetratricopeptide repeat protein [Candidatus Sulfotelmatobacter sp.]|nr:tetratricopeptide repeat protein [Candidatus Sulfotelmatobacter sp.]